MGQKTLGSVPKTRADLQIELLVAWLCAAMGCFAKLGQAAWKSGFWVLLTVVLFPCVCLGFILIVQEPGRRVGGSVW